MLLQSTHLVGLLGAITLSAGLASSISLAQEPSDTDSVTKSAEPLVEVEEAETQVSKEDAKDADTDPNAQKDDLVEVRISLPDGRTIIRYEPAHNYSARYASMPTGEVTHRLPDGSRISYARAQGSGGSSSSSSRGGSMSHASGGGGGGGGGRSAAARSGGGASSSGGGGGGGGAGAGAGSASGSSSGSSTYSASTEGSAEEQASASGASSLPQTISSGGSYARFTPLVDQSSSSGSDDSSGSSQDAASPQSVPTIGDAQYGDGGAVGGQRVEFNDAGMGAAVIGNTVYFIGVELVQANQHFEVVTGTRIGADSVIMLSGRLPGGGDSLSSWDTNTSAIKLDFPSNTIVELDMFSQPEDADNPVRVERIWTVRIR